MHRGAGGFMNDEQFEKFYWPSFSALIYACIENGITPIPLFEGDYTPRLKYLRDAAARQGRGALRQDRPQDVQGGVRRRHVLLGQCPAIAPVHRDPAAGQGGREIIDLFSDTGSLILDSCIGIPDESRPENVLALKEAADELWRPLT